MHRQQREVDSFPATVLRIKLQNCVFSDCEPVFVMSAFSASAVAFNVQKNFANKFFSNKTIVKGMIDDTSAKLLDDLYNLLFAFVSAISLPPENWSKTNFQTNDKKASEQTTTNVIKITVKIGMLFRGDKFSPDEKKDLQTIQKSLRNTSMTLISFFETDFTYDKSYLVRHISGLEDQLKSLVAPHLTEKSVGRVEQIFSVMKTPEFLDSTFVPGQKPEMRPLMAEVIADLNACMEAGVL